MTASPSHLRALAVAAALLAACGGGAKGPPPPPPAIGAFEAAPGLVVGGSPASLTATFENGAGTVDQGVGPVTSGAPVAVTPAADTTYTLTVTGPGGPAVTRTATVLVNAPPAIAAQPRTQWALLGDPVTLAVTASASGALAHQWLKDGAELPGETGPALAIASAQAGHAGDYAVRLTSTRGDTVATRLSDTAHLGVDPLTCAWAIARREPLDALPAGAGVATAAGGSQGPATAGGRSGWVQVASSARLEVPTALQASDDVVAVQADLYLPPGAEAREAELVLPADAGGGAAAGGVKASLTRTAGGVAAVRLLTGEGGTWTVRSSQPLADPAGGWHRLSLRGRRSTCSFAVAVDGQPAGGLGGGCRPGAGAVALASTSAPVSLSGQGAAWSNLSAAAGSGTWCVSDRNASACAPGDRRCAGPLVQGCAVDDGGRLAFDAGTSCTGSLVCLAGSAACGVAADATSVTGALAYEVIQPNLQRTDWAPAPVVQPARGLLVQSIYPDPASAGSFLLLDEAVVGDGAAAGAFTVAVRPAPDRTADDRLVFAAIGLDGAGDPAYGVGDPRFAGQLDPGATGPSPRLWSWSARLADLRGPLTITTGQGSAAAWTFDSVRAAWQSMRAAQGRDGLTLLTWVGLGTSWTCGACFAPFSTTLGGVAFSSQIWLAGDASQSYWSNAVTAHELGHWAMSSFGRSPNEGGPHFLGVPTFPGQAWSEGWATFFSADQRNDPVQLDKQQGTMFWFSLDARAYGNRAWTRPTPAGGLLQKMDENEVAATLWDLSARGASSGPLHAALASPRLTTSPFLRGYTRHTWTTTTPGVFENVVDTGVSAPALPDALDALICAGFGAAALDAAVQPAVFYPYPSASPLCP